MKYTTNWLIAILLTTGVTSQAVTIAEQADLRFIVGEGSNLSTLVIDFNDGTERESFAWGYRWEVSASGEDLFRAIVAADPQLLANEGSFINEISYVGELANHQGIGSYPGNSWNYFIAGGFAGDEDTTDGIVGTPTPIAGGGENFPTDFVSSPVGFTAVSFSESGRLLSDGSWDRWSFGPFPDEGTIEAPFAVIPEPQMWTLLGLSALGMLSKRKRS